MHLIDDHAHSILVPIRFAASKIIEGDTDIIDRLKLEQNEKEMIEHIIVQMEEECGNRQPVRLKFGYSYLRKKNGSLLSFSDWKQQADDMLCSNK